MASDLLPLMELPILPLRTMVLFPHAALPMTLGRATASQAGNDTVMVILEGLERIAVVDIVQTHPCMRARVRRLASERPRVDSLYTASRSNLLDSFAEMVKLSAVLPDELGVVARTIGDDAALTDMIGSALAEIAPSTRQDILATLNVRRRVDKLNEAVAHEAPRVAVALAWTASGGEILYVECTLLGHGRGHITLTGQMGDVMQESARTAVSWVRAHASRYGIAEDLFEKHDIHMHVPAGAVPKDRPSAGIVMVVSLVSLLTNRPVKPYTALTGEITLSGVLLPIGGIKENVLAARRNGLRSIVVPMDNDPHLRDEVPEHLRGGVEVRLAASIEQAIDFALSPEGGALMATQKIQDVMTKQVHCVSETASIREVARLMRDQNIGDVLVTDAQSKLCGIITDRDIVVRAVADEGNDLDQLRAKDVCTGDRIVTLAPTDGVDEAIRLMTEKAIRRIPVVENEQPVGIVTIGDLAAHRDPDSALGQISQAAPNN